MPRYITVDDALNAMCDNCDSVQAICPHYPCKRYKAVERIHFADVVEVVRCKDCKHRQQYDCNNITLGGTKCGVTDDWFCADGERKEEEDEDE